MCKYILGIYYINICINTIINKRGKKLCLLPNKKNSIQIIFGNTFGTNLPVDFLSFFVLCTYNIYVYVSYVL